MCFVWLMARRRDLGKGRRVVVLALLATVLFTGLNWRGGDRLAQWFCDTRDFTSRMAAWQDGWQVVRDFKFAGKGTNTPTRCSFTRNTLPTPG
jgi:hypothetical protein